MRADNVRQCFGEYGRVIEALRTEQAKAEVGGGLGEGDVDVVEDFDVVAEEADGLEDDALVTFVADGGESLLDGGTDPGATCDALALEGEEPSVQARLAPGGGGEDESCGVFRFDSVWVRRGLWLRAGACTCN